MKLLHPTGYDAALVMRVELLVSRREDIHALQRLRETYWGACVVGKLDIAMDCEERLRALMPFTHVYLGNVPKHLRGQHCQIMRRFHGRPFIRFADGGTLVCWDKQLRALDRPHDSDGPRCDECGDGGKQLSLHSVGDRMLCQGCRGEFELGGAA
jgi:hypothetical protein